AAIWRVPDDKVSVLYSGVNDRFRPVTDTTALAAVRARYGLGDRPYVLAVGTVQPRKNYELLVRAFRAVTQAGPHVLVIAGGRGWLTEGLDAEITRQGVADRVILPGFVDDADLPALYSAASLFVFPSLYEGFGLPLLEAMACGVPIISSDASSLPEVAATGGEPAALLLPPDDEAGWSVAMLRLLAGDAARQRLISAGKAQAARFTWQAAARQLAALYERLLAL
ncbi:MAG: glycosyltransferase family 4 protein, partial [Candidatus Promineofilum sp.]|nr:glycosyltransferase family 4 protein [Promineifilum sp.]